MERAERASDARNPEKRSLSLASGLLHSPLPTRPRERSGLSMPLIAAEK